MAEHRRRKRARGRILRTWKWWIAPLVLLLALGGTGGYLLVGAVKINGEIKKISNLHHLVASPKHGAEKATTNILLVGSTDRCALSVQNPAYGLCQDGVDGINSDILMVLHLNPNTKTASILSIPRDLFIPNARSTGANKVDAGLVEGPDQLIAAVEEDFGIPIQHFAELNFETFANVVNDLGGVKMYFPMPVYDQESGLHITTPGCHDLNGVEALEVVRSRHLHYNPGGYAMDDPLSWPQDPLSDLSRIRRTHEFLRVLASAVAKRGLGNPFTDESLLSDVAPQLQVDSTFNLSTMLSLASTYHTVNPYKSAQLTLPVIVDSNLNYQYDGYGYGNVEFPDEPQDQDAINTVLGVDDDTDTMTGEPLPAPSTIKVDVENGTGVANQATTTSAALQALGYQIANVGDVTPVGPESETTVQYDSRAPGVEAAAERVARSLTGSVILSYVPSPSVPDGAEVEVITGSNFSVVSAPASSITTTTSPNSSTSSTAATTTTTSGGSSTTTTTGPSNTGSDTLQPVSAATSSLAPFDPRSCTASGGEGP